MQQHGREPPSTGTRVKRAHKLRGQKLIVSDYASTNGETADLFLHPKPGPTWLALRGQPLSVGHGMADTKFLDQWVNGLADTKRALHRSRWSLPRDLGLSEDTLKKVAHLIVEATRLHPGGPGCHAAQHGWTPRPRFRTAAHYGNYMRTGTGAYPLRGTIMSRAPRSRRDANNLPGYQSVNDPKSDRVSSRMECATSFDKRAR